MTDTPPRSTDTRAVRRTAAATVANRRRKSERLALELSPRLGQLSDEWLAAFAATVLAACRLRGVEVPDLLGDE